MQLCLFLVHDVRALELCTPGTWFFAFVLPVNTCKQQSWSKSILKASGTLCKHLREKLSGKFRRKDFASDRCDSASHKFRAITICLPSATNCKV